MTEVGEPFEVGLQLGSVALERLVAVGRFSVVYRGADGGGAAVAVKVGNTMTAASQDRIRREGKLLTTLAHPGLVPVVEAGEHEGQPYLITAWIEGRSLVEELARKRRLTSQEALTIGRQLADVLDYLHQNEVLYRDLSPSNIIVDDRNRVTLIDLGSAHRTGQASAADSGIDAAVTEDQAIAATAAYVAPELIRGTPQPGPTADQYSLAAILYELVAGRPPFPPQDNAAATLYQHLDGEPVPLLEAAPDAPAAFAKAIHRGLAKEPGERFGSTRSLVEAASAQLEPRQPATAQRRTGRTKPDRKKAWLLAVGGAVLLLAAGGWALASRLGTDDTNTTNSWAAGTAAGLSCNLLAVPGFDQGVAAADIYPTPPDSERVVDGTGIDGTPALEAGRDGAFSQYAEWVPTQVGQRYRFAGWFRTTGDVADAKLGVTFIDNGSDIVAETEQAIEPGQLRFLVVETEAAPATTAAALPWLFKDASPGSLIADELVFAPTPGCADELIDATRTTPSDQGGGDG